MTKEEKVKSFNLELSWIGEEKLREFAKDLIEHAEDYFFNVPASSSGKYHPSFDLGDGGLVRHTRCVAFFAKTMAESLDFNDHDKDLLIIAALAHDIRKQGDNKGYTVREHPLLAAEYVKFTSAMQPELIAKEDVEKICGAVESHMGRWEHRTPWLKNNNQPFPMPRTDFEKALQAADYVASRKEILGFDFGENTPTNIVESTSEKPVHSGEPKDYVIQFGKHKGKTLEEIKSTGYLEWMIKQEDFFNKEAQEMARMYLFPTSSTETKVEDYVDETITDNLPF